MSKKDSRDVLHYFMTHKAILLLVISDFFLIMYIGIFFLYINKLCFPKATHGDFVIRKAQILARDLIFLDSFKLITPVKN